MRRIAAKPEIVLRRPSITGECPVWCERSGALYWVDVQQPALHRLDPATGLDEHWTMPAWIGSFALGADPDRDCAVVALRTGVFRFDFGTGTLSQLAPVPFDPRRFFLNDGKCDPAGRFWVGAMRHGLVPEIGPPADLRTPLWRLDGDALRPFGGAMRISNGLAWSPDGRTMYHSGTEAGVIDAYDYDVATGTPSGRRTFARIEGEGGPDGAAIDRDGFYWTAVNGQGRILRLDPDGRVEREVAVPVRYPTMVAFGGTDLRTLYVTSGRWAIPDRDAATLPVDGSILAFEAPAPGLPADRWRASPAT